MKKHKRYEFENKWHTKFEVLKLLYGFKTEHEVQLFLFEGCEKCLARESYYYCCISLGRCPKKYRNKDRINRKKCITCKDRNQGRRCKWGHWRNRPPEKYKNNSTDMENYCIGFLNPDINKEK